MNLVTGSTRTTVTGQPYASLSLSFWPYGIHAYVTPTEKEVAIGRFKLFQEQLRAAPEAVTTVYGNGTGTVQVHPVYVHDAEVVPKFATDQRLELATKDDLLAGRDVRGKLVVVDSQPWYSIHDEVELATKAGAAGVLNHNVGESISGYGWLPWDVWLNSERIPVLWLDRDQWSEVVKVLDGASRAYVDIRSQVVSPYEYKLRFYEYGRIPSGSTINSVNRTWPRCRRSITRRSRRCPYGRTRRKPASRSVQKTGSA